MGGTAAAILVQLFGCRNRNRRLGRPFPDTGKSAQCGDVAGPEARANRTAPEAGLSRARRRRATTVHAPVPGRTPSPGARRARAPILPPRQPAADCQHTMRLRAGTSASRGSGSGRSNDSRGSLITGIPVSLGAGQFGRAGAQRGGQARQRAISELETQPGGGDGGNGFRLGNIARTAALLAARLL